MQEFEALRNVISAMIKIRAEEFSEFSSRCSIRKYNRKSLLAEPGNIPQEVFFITSGILRVLLTDRDGSEHTIHFATENQFIADYGNFIMQTPAVYTLEALEDLTVVVIPRATIEWGYQHLEEGDKLGRLIAEYYFIYQDTRIRNQYRWTPGERFANLQQVFPDLINRVPQHMIASFLGITSVHLSRLKGQAKDQDSLKN